MLKKAIAICSVVALSTGVFAQKAKVVSAYNYLNAYERGKKCSELKNGKEAIDAASENDQTRSEAKTWYYRGNIYFAISEDKNCKSQDADHARRRRGPGGSHPVADAQGRVAERRH